MSIPKVSGPTIPVTLPVSTRTVVAPETVKPLSLFSTDSFDSGSVKSTTEPSSTEGEQTEDEQVEEMMLNNVFEQMKRRFKELQSEMNGNPWEG